MFIESAKAHVSCCVTVKNIDRRIYLLKRDARFDVKKNGFADPETEVLMADVYAEFDQKIANRSVFIKCLSNCFKKQFLC